VKRTPNIGIIDIGIGNLGSLRQAVHSQGWDTVFVSRPDDLADLTHLLLPGVGAFSAAVQRLHHSGLFTAIRRFAAEGRPVLGICLGMQLLAERGTEGGDIEGLGLVPGRVIPIEAPGLRLPHVGWNNARQAQPHPLLEGIRNDVDFYFVHSYRLSAVYPGHVLARTEYGESFPSIVGKGNVAGAQFHPEKSQANGLRLLDNFCRWDGTC
jgi:glutamine amidotransferase